MHAHPCIVHKVLQSTIQLQYLPLFLWIWQICTSLGCCALLAHMRVPAIFTYQKGFLGLLSSTQRQWLDHNFREPHIAGCFQRIQICKRWTLSTLIERYWDQPIILFTHPKDLQTISSTTTYTPCIFSISTWWFDFGCVFSWKILGFPHVSRYHLLIYTSSTKVIDCFISPTSA